MQEDIRSQLRALRISREYQYDELQRAWRNARESRNARPLLIPYIGSGLNNLVEGGLGSWGELVRLIAQRGGPLGSAHQIAVSQLSLPQQLEIHLRKALAERRRGDVVQSFRDVFSVIQTPSTLHRRIMEMFPAVITTNYNCLLEAAAPAAESIDLTDPAINLGDIVTLAGRRVLHLHGKWYPDELTLHDAQIFWGVGEGPAPDSRCLVLTEYQYHRLYRARADFRNRVQRLFETDHLMLFLGASLARDEADIHALLTDRRLQGGRLAGFYVSVEPSSLKDELLRVRGIETISLPRKYGFKRDAVENFLHAFLDVCDESFGVNTLSRSGVVVPSPDILCVGLAKWEHIISLGDRTQIGRETSHNLDASNYLEEAGGQHLAPALHLMRRGHRVALATVLGDDELADRIIGAIRDMVKTLDDAHLPGDLITYFCEQRGSTHRGITVTFGGGRVIFDYHKAGEAERELGRADLHKFSAIRALYLGTYSRTFGKEALRSIPAIRFFETGTRGPTSDEEFTDALDLARQCTYVLASAEFTLRLARDDRLDTDCQARIFADYADTQEKLQGAFERLWKPGGKANTLVVLMGEHGAVVMDRPTSDFRVTHVPAVSVPAGAGRNWLGCGDIFRGEFIHQILAGTTAPGAAHAASRTVAEKIQRMSLFATLPFT